MAIADGRGLPLAVTIASASPGEVTLVEQTLDAQFLTEAPVRLIGDKAYDSDRLDARLAAERDIELIAPNRSGRGKTLDGRQLRRYCRRWKIERLFAWLQNFRRLVTRYERHAINFLAFVQLGCIVILGRQFVR
jgi:transposase